MDPRTRIVLLGLVGVLAVALEQPTALAALALLCALPTWTWAGQRGWRLRGAFLIAAGVWGMVLSQALFYDGRPRVALATLGPLTIWQEGATYGLVQSLRLVATTLAGLAIAVSTPPDRLFAAMLRLRVPFGAAFLAITALRFVPQVSREVWVVRCARARRGRPVHHRSPWAWLALEISLLRPVVARALRRSRTLAESLDMRGFDPAAPRAVRRPLRMHAWEPGLIAVASTATAVVVTSRLLFLLYTAEIFYLPRLRPLYGFVRDWL